MMVIDDVAAATVAILAPYVAKGTEELAKKVGGEVASRIVTLYDKVKAKLTGASAQEAVTDLEKSPDDADVQATLRRQVKKALQADATFLEEMRELIGGIPEKERESIKQVLSITGDHSKGAQVTGDRNVTKM